jgi:hypothetical protein
MVRYKLKISGCDKLWAASMRLYMQRLLGTDNLGAKTLELLTTTWAKSTSEAYYGSAIVPYFEFCEEHYILSLTSYKSYNGALHCMDRRTMHHQGNEYKTLRIVSQQ